MSPVFQFALALAIVVPIVALGTLVSIRRGALPGRAFTVVVGMQALLLLLLALGR